VPETHKHAEDLVRIFKKKIKRAKKVAAGEEEDGDDDDLSDLDDLDDEEDEEFCPPGCDPALYDVQPFHQCIFVTLCPGTSRFASCGKSVWTKKMFWRICRRLLRR
jgi:hypothetical protein